MPRIAIAVLIINLLLHVVFKVNGELFLVWEKGFGQTMIQNNVNSALDCLLGPLVSFFGRWVGACQLDVAELPCLQFSSNLVHYLADQFDLVGVAENFVIWWKNRREKRRWIIRFIRGYVEENEMQTLSKLKQRKVADNEFLIIRII